MNYLFGFLIVASFNYLFAEDEKLAMCHTSNVLGYCVPLQWCPYTINLLATSTNYAVSYFEESKCGEWKVCCGTWKKGNHFTYLNFGPRDNLNVPDYREYEIPSISNDTAPMCHTSDTSGYCVALQWCPHIIKLLATSKSSVVSYFEESKCGEWKVCCGTWKKGGFGPQGTLNLPSYGDYEIPSILNDTIQSNRNYVMAKILPATTYCGLQHTDDRIFNDTTTALDETPWLVNFRIFYTFSRGGQPTTTPGPDKYQTFCAGVLISNRHVLSSSFCSWKRFHVAAAVLGLYHTRESSTCIDDPITPECTDPVLIIPIAREFHIADSNIVLYKLNKTVTYSDYVRPICLPFKQSTRPDIGGLIITSGWNDPGFGDREKKRITNELTPIEECSSEELSNAFVYGYINSNYAMCTKIEENSNTSTCTGDLGGPFTYSYKHQWFLEGITNLIGYGQNRNPSGDCTDNKYLIGEKLTPEILNYILDAIYYVDKEFQ